MIKVDFERTTPEERAELVKRQGGVRRRMLAEKIETQEQFLAAQQAGFVYCRWIRLVALISAGMLKSSDRVLSALVRARFCELLSPKAPKAESDLFLVGLVSLMDAILEVPVADALEKISLDQHTKEALMGGAGPLGPIYQLMLAQEAGQWEQAKDFARQLHVTESEARELWWAAMKWARQVRRRT